MASKLVCDKCGEEITIKMVNINQNNKNFIESIDKLLHFEDFNKMFNQPHFTKEIEGSKIIVNLPKYKMEHREFDLCEKCTKIFFEENIKKWLKLHKEDKNGKNKIK
jgi:hypothetical protein